MLSDLKKPSDSEKFLTDFFNADELERYVKRLATVYWLKKGRDTDNIKRNLTSTTKEIAEAQRLLEKDGLKIAIKKIEAEEWVNQWAEKINKFKTKK